MELEMETFRTKHGWAAPTADASLVHEVSRRVESVRVDGSRFQCWCVGGVMKLKHYICECLVIPTLAVKANVIVTLTTID
jgi:hypothetical protein